MDGLTPTSQAGLRRLPQSAERRSEQFLLRRIQVPRTAVYRNGEQYESNSESDSGEVVAVRVERSRTRGVAFVSTPAPVDVHGCGGSGQVVGWSFLREAKQV